VAPSFINVAFQPEIPGIRMLMKPDGFGVAEAIVRFPVPPGLRGGLKMRVLACVLLLAAPFAFGQTILFEDDFSDGNYDGWLIHGTGATYQVNSDLRFEFSYNGTEEIYSMAYRGDLGESMSVVNYSVLVETITHSPTGKTGLNVRYTEATGTSYGLYLNYSTGNYYILRYDSFSSWVMLGGIVPFQGGFIYDTPYWVRYECIDDLLRAKIWTGGSGDEPDEWDIVRYDGTYIDNGCIDRESLRPSGTTVFDTEFDNIVVTDFPDALESSTWGAIKSSF